MEETAPLKSSSPSKEKFDDSYESSSDSKEVISLRRRSYEYEPSLDMSSLYIGPQIDESSYKSTLKVLSLNTLPPIFIYLVIFSIRNVILYYLKKHNDNQLVDAFGIAFSFLQIIGTTVYMALCIGLTSCSAQAFGAKKYQLFGVYIHRGLFVNLIVCIPCGIVIFYAGEIARAFGFNPEVAKIVNQITFPCLIGIFFGMLYATQNAYLNAAEIFVPSAIALGFAGIIFWAVAYLLFRVYDMGLSAIYISFNCFHISASILIFLYIKIYDPIPGTFFWFKKQSFEEIWTLFKYEFYVGSMIFLEWICVEINYLMSGSLRIVQVTAITIATINYSTWYSVPISLADTVLAFVGNSVGEKNARKAKNFVLAGLTFGGAFIIVVLTFYIFLSREAAAFYTTDEAVIEKTMDLFKLYLLLYPADCIQIVFSSGLRALGREKLGSLMFVVCFYMIGLPISYVLGFPVGWGVLGITVGYIVGLYVMLTWLLIVYWNMDWKKQIKEVNRRLREDKKRLQNMD